MPSHGLLVVNDNDNKKQFANNKLITEYINNTSTVLLITLHMSWNLQIFQFYENSDMTY